MNVLITGATGFIGKEIVAELKFEVANIFQVGNRGANFETANGGTFKVDITNSRNVSELQKLRKVDAVFHSAGLAHQFGNIEKNAFVKTNVVGTKNILELAVSLGARHFILISSTAVYGTKKKKGSVVEIIDETTVCNPQTYYAESKLEAEKIAGDLCRRHKIDLTILRLSPVIGEDNSGNVARMIEAIDKKRFVWIGNGENYKTLIYKKDVARACNKVLKNKRTGIEIFNLAAEPISMRDFVVQAAKSLNTTIPKISISPEYFEKIFQLNENFLHIARISKLAGTIEKWLSDDVYSAKKIRREYNFKPETTLTEALEKQVAAYLKKKKKGVSRRN